MPGSESTELNSIVYKLQRYAQIQHAQHPRRDAGAVAGHADGSADSQPGTARDIVTLNAGAALYAANVVDSMAAGVLKAREVISSGAAKAKLEQLVAASKRLGAGA